MKLIQVLLLILLLFFVYACNDKNNSSTPNPCYNAKAFAGGLSVMQQVGDTLIEADTIVNGYIYLVPLGNSIDSMRWNIGDKDPFIKNSAVRLFVTGIVNESLAVI